jgi:hypothetical protein
MLDMTIYVIRSFELPSGEYRIQARWVNRRGLDIGIVEDFTIKPEEVRNWYLFSQ